MRAHARRGASLLATLVLLALAAPRELRAWGSEGHRVVALIAYRQLSPKVRARVDELLSTDDSGLTRDRSMAAESTWADRYRDSDRDRHGPRYTRTWQWHFVDLEIDSPNLISACHGEPAVPPGLPASRGPARDCVVDKIVEFSRELRASSTPTRERLRALQFLVHLVGDLHQPLHSADRHDRGGNALRVVLPGGRASNLHAAWDSRFVADLDRSPRRLAETLAGEITPAQRRRWSRGTPADWARETERVAARIAYGDLPQPDARGRVHLGPAYVAAATAATRTQLERAGVRLAALLNADL